MRLLEDATRFSAQVSGVLGQGGDWREHFAFSRHQGRACLIARLLCDRRPGTPPQSVSRPAEAGPPRP